MKSAKFQSPERGEMDPRLAAICDFLTGQKGLAPFSHVFPSQSAIADAIIIVTATSRRHAQGLADGVLKTLRDLGARFLGMEGYEQAQWILIDANDIIIHIFQEEARALYRLEDLCADSSPKEAKA